MLRGALRKFDRLSLINYPMQPTNPQSQLQVGPKSINSFTQLCKLDPTSSLTVEEALTQVKRQCLGAREEGELNRY